MNNRRLTIPAKWAFWLIGLCLVSCSEPVLEKAETCLQLEDYPRAARFFDRALDREPDSFRARYGYALALQEIARTKKSLNRDSVQDWLPVVQAYAASMELGEAQTLKENYATALYHLSNKFFQDGNHLASLEHLAKAQELSPENPYVMHLLGIVQWNLGWLPEAETAFEYLIALDSGFIAAYLNLGNVRWEREDSHGALEIWNRALERDGGNVTLRQRIELALKED